ncbi:MAG: glycosyltransferase family 4 protein [Phycisphaerae bacterium]|nr:glycosyltransferase family 4 protein [Phycisphaerae bacterium]
MRIAMVGVRGIPASVGGAEHAVEELTRELTARGHEVIVYSRRTYVGDTPPPQVGRRIITAGLAGKHLETFTHTATALADVLRRGADVVHLHSPGPALLIWLPKLAGISTVLTIHAPDWERQKWSPPARWALRWGLACGMRLADEVTAVSKGLAQELSARFGRQVHYVPNGIRPAQPLPPRAIARWGLERRPYVLTVGRVVPEKRLDLLLDAWAELSAADKAGAVLVVVGDVTASPYGLACRRRRGADVEFLGNQTGDVLSELYSNAELVVLPSALEGMSLVLLEAAAYGQCILAADIPANLDIMGQSIVYFHSKDRLDLRRQLRLILGDQELRRSKSESATAQALASSTWSAAAEILERVYHRAVLQDGGL